MTGAVMRAAALPRRSCWPSRSVLSSALGSPRHSSRPSCRREKAVSSRSRSAGAGSPGCAAARASTICSDALDPRGAFDQGGMEPLQLRLLEPDIHIDKRKPRHQMRRAFPHRGQRNDPANPGADHQRPAGQGRQHGAQILHLRIEVIAAVGGVAAFAMAAQVNAERISSRFGKRPGRSVPEFLRLPAGVHQDDRRRFRLTEGIGNDAQATKSFKLATFHVVNLYRTGTRTRYRSAIGEVHSNLVCEAILRKRDRQASHANLAGSSRTCSRNPHCPISMRTRQAVVKCSLRQPWILQALTSGAGLVPRSSLPGNAPVNWSLAMVCTPPVKVAA